ncbi:DUF389 domain-containing protein [Fibrella aquatilis]|uniref:DUF389 domain-containing protein n=1 Tax=Fibrella aquatilis TaxID=2817059 RepID=A0A939K2E6_9BACT|nr:DUF389 domain-containing protein [Fibrella aquatilis]MBO0934001.1 DUF389 domain-containing protein [Fibrella aquatilis]
MHRTFSVSLPSSHTDRLLDQLRPLAYVVGLSIERGSSIKPPGDVLTIQVLNRGADEVLRCVADVCQQQSFSVATAELASLIDLENHALIEKDYDEAVWEEIETGLRHNGRLTPNYVALMGIGGVVAAVGLVSDPAPQAVSIVAAAVLAPGFDPLAKVALGVLNRRKQLILMGLRNTLIGYGVLILCAGLSFWLMRLTGATTVADFINNPEVKSLSDPDMKQYLMSIGGAIAGGIIVASYRDSFIAGALMAMAFIHAAAMVGVSLVAGQWHYAVQGLERFGLDALFIVVGCYLVFGLKQVLVHNRKPIV